MVVNTIIYYLYDMIINTIIEVQAFGDFNKIYTECIMVSSDIISEENLCSEFFQTQEFSSFKNLSYEQLRTMTDDFIAFLELRGFYKLETYIVRFSD